MCCNIQKCLYAVNDHYIKCKHTAILGQQFFLIKGVQGLFSLKSEAETHVIFDIFKNNILQELKEPLNLQK